MTTENTKIWDALAKTDPTHTKKFSRSGGFKGTSVKPIYTTRKMTEQFGPAGKGWGMDEPRFDVVTAGDQILVYCTVGLWWEQPSQKVYGVGGDIVHGKNKNGPFVDDEAFKKSYTDALSNAMKQIGMSADIHMGQHDDDKYVSELKAEFANGNGHAETEPTNGNGKKQPNHGEARGAMNITTIKQKMGEFQTDLDACEEAGQLHALLTTSAELLKACQRDLPGWWNSKPNSDVVGFDDRIKNKMAELAKAERNLAHGIG